MKIILSVFFTVWISIASTFSYAQSLGLINGKVVDKNKKPIEGASVVLLQNGASLVNSLTEADGSFNFKLLKPASYTLAVNAMGFKVYKGSVIEITTSKSSVNLDPIVLEPLGVALKEVQVTAQKSFVENKIDRTVVNVNTLVANTGSNALEVLEKAPGVSVDENGNITFKGRSGVMVLIDDKPTYLSAADLAVYLRSLPAGTLDKIELMDNPPAKYEAAGNGGVINIKTKKSTSVGSNGSISVSYRQGRYPQTSESLNWNYRVNKINVFTNASYSYNDPYRKLGIRREYFDESGNLNSAFDQVTYMRNKNHNVNIKLGLDFYQSPKTTWGIVFSGLSIPTSSGNTGNSMLSNSAGVLDSTLTTISKTKNRFDKRGVGLNYAHQFDSTGKSISVDMDYVHFASRSDETFFNNSFYPNGDLKASQTIGDHIPSNINIYAIKTDYALPLRGKAKLEMGLKSSYITTDNAANYFDLTNGQYTPIEDKTNHFLYKENINAAYLNFNKSFKRFDIQAGLRLENTNGYGHQLGNTMRADSSFNNHYINLFPTAYFSYKLDSSGHNLLIASYGRRIERPNYRSLNPFVFLLDKYSYFAGDPYIKPQFVNNYKLSYSYKSIVTGAVFFNYITDVLSEKIQQQGDIFISRLGNIGTQKDYGASVNLALQPFKWWTANIYGELIRNSYKGELYGHPLNMSSVFGSVNSTQQFLLGDGWNAELSGFYNSRRVYGQFINYPKWQINAGIQKKIMHNRAAIKLNMRDIFNVYSSNGIIKGIPNAIAYYSNYFDSRALILGFTYNFGKLTGNTKKRDTGSSESEQGRVK